MDPMKKNRRFIRLIQREAAERYLSLTLISFAASVTLTRLLLSLTNYPQFGSGELHIAHVLWGGLLLYISALLPLLFANREAYTLSAVLAGVGIGLFIDEVGKFITQNSNYFFPAAASIIYIFFLLTLLLFINLRRGENTRARDDLVRDFEDIWELLHQPLPTNKYLQLKTHLETTIKSAPSKGHADLAEALLKFLEVDEPQAPPEPEKTPGFFGQVKQVLSRLFSQINVKVYLIIGLLGIGLLTLKNPVTVLLTPWLPAGVVSFLDSLRLGGHLEGDPHQFLFLVRTWLEVLVGVLLLLSAFLMLIKRDRSGTALGYFALILSLTTVDVLLFYYEQFSTILTTLIQFLLIFGIGVYHRHSVQPASSGERKT